MPRFNRWEIGIIYRFDNYPPAVAFFIKQKKMNRSAPLRTFFSSIRQQQIWNSRCPYGVTPLGRLNVLSQYSTSMIRANEARFPAFPAASRTIDMPSRYSTFKSPILWQAADDESTLPSIKTGGDAVESIEQDMTNVLSQEIEVLENDDEVRNFQNLKKLVIQNGFQV